MELERSDEAEERERQARIDRGDLKEASTQQLLADMYANATDEERASLMESAHKGRDKREGLA